MANIIKYPGAAFPFSFARQNSAPLDNTAVLATLSDLNTYAANLDKSYVPYRGLIISCEETDAAYILISESGKLVPKKIASDLPPLTDYATKLWVLDKGYWIDVPTLRSQWNEAYNLRHSHANKLALDGIILTDISSWNNAGLLAHDHTNKTVLDTITSLSTSNWNQAFGWGNHGDLAYAKQAITITAGSGLTGGGNLSANRTISLSNSGVLSGTYTKFNVDVYGRVTSGTTLILADIPTLSISKVSGLQQALDGSLGQEVFNDMFEKVNVGTVESPSYVIKAKYGFFSVGEVSAYGSGGSGGGGGTGLIQTVYSYPQLGGSFSDTTLTDTFNAYTINKIHTDFINHTHTFTSLTGKPTTLGGYGITDSVLNTDIRLTNSRPASDVYPWAKAVDKPSYSYGEITGTPPTADLSSYVKKTGDSISGQLSLTIPKGTSPLLVTSDTLVNNLNVQYLNGQLGSYYTSYADSAVAGAAVGGRNLVLDSTNPNRLPAYGVTATISKTPDSNLSGFKTVFSDIVRTIGNEVFYVPFGNSPGYFSQSMTGVDVIISFYIRTNSPQLISFQGVMVDSNWKRIEGLYKYSGAGNFHIQLVGANLQWVEIHSLKIEKGNKATDWTPAPEDVQAEIDKKLNLTGGVLTGSITAPSFIKSGGASTQLLRADGGVADFIWSGQGGQPDWVWGGNSANNYFVWNPANFNVASSKYIVPEYNGNRDLNTLYSDFRVLFYERIGIGSLNLFPVSNNANGVLSFSTHNNSYGTQLGFSSNGNIYKRRIEAGIWDSSWKTILDSSNWASIIDGRYLPLTGGTLSGDVLSTGFFRTTAWFQNNISGLGLYNAAEDAYWHAQDGYWNASKQIRVNGSLVWHAGNDGTGSGLDADLLDGVHGSGYLLNRPSGAGSNLDLNNVDKIFIGPGYGVTNSPFPGDQGVISIPTWNSYGKYTAQFVAQLGNYNLCYRTTNVYGEGAWKHVAFIDSNVSSATKLQTSRTIFGQPFDGTGDISGDFHVVGSTFHTGAYSFFRRDGVSPGIYIAANHDGSLSINGHLQFEYTKDLIKIDYPTGTTLIRGKCLVASDQLSPTISLAIGDHDTGFDWGSDGYVRVMADGQATAYWNTNEFYVNKNLFAGGIISGFGGLFLNNLSANGHAHIRLINGVSGRQWGIKSGFFMNNENDFTITDDSATSVPAFSISSNNQYCYVNSIVATDWVRTVGACGWYNETFFGGIHMIDSDWVRIYNDKKFFVSNTATASINTLGGILAGGQLKSESGRLELGLAAIVHDASNNAIKIVNANNTSCNIYATGEVSAYSDRRLKSNIRSLDNRGRLSAKTFLKDNKQLIGFIALDVLELYPELISTTSGPELYLSLNYGAITAVLSIQINNVEDEVSILKLKVKQLENKIKQYEEINF